MPDLTQALALAGVLGSGTVGGIFFAFSSFVMPALARLPAAQGHAAMQAINITVLRPSFLVTFVGTALLSLVAIGHAVLHWEAAGAAWLAAAGALYVIGTFLVTGVRNVPLNDELERVQPNAPHANATWDGYLRRWTVWNHARTAAALAATSIFALALIQNAAG